MSGMNSTNKNHKALAQPDRSWLRKMTFPLLRAAQHSALADGCPFPAGDLGAIGDKVGDDDRGREEEQAEDEVPDEAVALPASDPGGPERDCDPDDSEQDPPQDRHDMSPSAFRAERLYLLPDGSVSTSHGAAPRRSAHHPGITPGRVICGERDDSPIGTALAPLAHACLQSR
jgi:hypothetical protein